MAIIRRIRDRDEWLEWRRHDLTASDVAAVAGLDPYRTALRIYAEKAGDIAAQVENNLMRRGRWLEPAVIAALREERPDWKIIQPHVYLTDKTLRLGGTPDALAEPFDEPGGLINVQCKTVGRPTFERDWQNGPPVGYQLQALTEGLLLDAVTSYVAALVLDTYSASLELYHVPRHAEAEAKVQQLAASFWENIAAGRRPLPDYDRDADTVRELYPAQVPGKMLDLTGDNRLPDLLDERAALKSVEGQTKVRITALDTEIKAKLGDAEAATLPGWKLSFKVEKRSAYTVAEQSIRVLRVSPAKEEAA